MDMLDVRGLSNDQIEFIQQLIEFRRQKHQRPLFLLIVPMESL